MLSLPRRSIARKLKIVSFLWALDSALDFFVRNCLVNSNLIFDRYNDQFQSLPVKALDNSLL